jgi:hypothetical protein
MRYVTLDSREHQTVRLQNRLRSAVREAIRANPNMWRPMRKEDRIPYL